MSRPLLAILSSNYGGGHNRTGEAIAAEWEARTGGRAEMVDYFTRFVHPVYDTVTRVFYIQSVKRAPSMYGLFYKWTGDVKPDSLVQRVINGMGMEGLVRYLATDRPQVVCCVHCTPAGTMSDLKIAGRISVPCLTVITDYVNHSQWTHPRVDRYCVPNATVRDGLVARGIAANRITVSGLPIAPKFHRPLDRGALLRKFGLAPGVPVILVMAGAYAMLGGVRDVVRRLARFRRPLQALVVCGHDRRLEDQIRTATRRSPHRFHVFGFVDNVEELMTVSDLLITKAGGVTVTEALAKHLPMVIYRPIPGQEEGNTRFLLEHGAALVAKRPAALDEILETLFGRPERLAAMRRAAAKIGRPDAARVVVSHLARLAAGSDSASPERSLALPSPTA